MNTGPCALVLCFAVSTLPAQTAPVVASAEATEFHDDVMKLFDFEPGTLPQKEMEAKSGELDAFWEKVKAHKSTLGLALRHELARDDAPKLFLYDGSMLLLDLGRKPAGAKPKAGAAADEAPVDKDDAKLVIAAMARCTLQGIQQSDYVRKIHWLASEGNDTTAAALHALDDPKFQAFIEQHALMLGQDFSVLCMLMPTDEAFYLQPALDRLKTEQDDKACKSLLKLLWYAASTAGDTAIQEAAEDASRSKAVREAAAQLSLMSMTIPLKIKGEERAKVAAALDVSVDATVAELSAARRKRMQANISDEALGDLDQFTLLIRSHAP